MRTRFVISQLIALIIWSTLCADTALAQEYAGKGFALLSTADCLPSGSGQNTGGGGGDTGGGATPINQHSAACPDRLLIGNAVSIEILHLSLRYPDNRSIFLGNKRASGGGFAQLLGFQIDKETMRLSSWKDENVITYRFKWFLWTRESGLIYRPPDDAPYVSFKTSRNGDVRPFGGGTLTDEKLGWHGYYHSACLVQNDCPSNHPMDGQLRPGWQGLVYWLPWVGGNGYVTSTPSINVSWWSEWDELSSEQRQTATLLEDYLTNPIVELWGGIYSENPRPGNDMIVKFFNLKQFFVDTRQPLLDCYTHGLGLPAPGYLRDNTKCHLRHYQDGNPWQGTYASSWINENGRNVIPWNPNIQRTAEDMKVFDSLSPREICGETGPCRDVPKPLSPPLSGEAAFYVCTGAINPDSAFYGDTPCSCE